MVSEAEELAKVKVIHPSISTSSDARLSHLLCCSHVGTWMRKYLTCAPLITQAIGRSSFSFGSAPENDWSRCGAEETHMPAHRKDPINGRLKLGEMMLEITMALR
jgi:hypothetical protein